MRRLLACRTTARPGTAACVDAGHMAGRGGAPCWLAAAPRTVSRAASTSCCSTAAASRASSRSSCVASATGGEHEWMQDEG